MSYYIGFRFKGIVKPEFRKDFTEIALHAKWADSSDERFRTFGEGSYARAYPNGKALVDSWETDPEFHTQYNEITGLWAFRTCFNFNGGGAAYDWESWEELLPYFMESIELYEIMWEDSDGTQLRGLVENTDKEFGKYIEVLK